MCVLGNGSMVRRWTHPHVVEVVLLKGSRQTGHLRDGFTGGDGDTAAGAPLPLPLPLCSAGTATRRRLFGRLALTITMSSSAASTSGSSLVRSITSEPCNKPHAQVKRPDSGLLETAQPHIYNT